MRFEGEMTEPSSDSDENIVENMNNGIDTDNAGLRRRRGPFAQPTVSNYQLPDNTDQNRMSTLRICLYCFAILIITFIFIYLVTSLNKSDFLLKTEDDTGSIFEEFFELQLEGTSVMNKYQAVLINLGAVLNSSDVISQNGAQIARELFDLSGDFNDAGREVSIFMEKAGDFFETLSSEIKDIEYILKYEKDGELIKKKLGVLKNGLPEFKEQLVRVIKALLRIKERSIHTQGYLRTGEKEARKVLKDHWLGNIVDYEERKEAEEMIKQVKYVLELLKNMMPNLINFENSLNTYRDRLLEVEKDIQTNRVRLKPTLETLKPLKKSIKKLVYSHVKFLREEGQMGKRPKDTLYIEDEMNEMNRDCTEFDIEFNKSNNVHLRKLRIWSSHFIHSIAFFYSDDSVVMFGTPGTGKPFDFEWHKDEKIIRFDVSFGSIVYGLQIITTKWRNTGWHGGKDGHRFYTEMEGRVFNGLFGSFSKYICSLEVSHGQ